MKTTATRLQKLRRTAVTTTLVALVTAVGVAIGAYGISPVLASGSAVDDAKRTAKHAAAVALKTADRPEAPYVAGALLLGATMLTSVRSMRRRRTQQVVIAKRAPAAQARTPRDIQALAAAGTAPVEIALRTRLPVDAVSMLMRINQAG